MAKEMEVRGTAPAEYVPGGGTPETYAGMSATLYDRPDDWGPVPPRTTALLPEVQRYYSYFAQFITAPLWAVKWVFTYWYRLLGAVLVILTLVIIFATR